MRAPSLYNYFASKMDIYDALFRLGFTLWGEIVEKAGFLGRLDELRELLSSNAG